MKFYQSIMKKFMFIYENISYDTFMVKFANFFCFITSCVMLFLFSKFIVNLFHNLLRIKIM